MSSASENAMSDLEAENYTQPYPSKPIEAKGAGIELEVADILVEFAKESITYMSDKYTQAITGRKDLAHTPDVEATVKAISEVYRKANK